MLKFLGQILGLSAKQPSAPQAQKHPEPSAPLWVAPPKPTDAYFKGIQDLQDCVSKRDYATAAQTARDNLKEIPAIIQSDKKFFCDTGGNPEDFEFSLRVPALDVGGTMMALMGDDDGLAEMRELVISHEELAPWLEKVEQHEQNRKLFVAILDAIQQNPGCLQTDMKSIVGVTDGRRIATLIGWLEKSGKIRREKQGKTYGIWIASSIG